ncbi:MAG TPA: TonB-dependent receptor, partial [Terriglobales bacterium]
MSKLREVWVLVSLLAGLNAAGQQITGNIRGTVTDPSGAVVRSAAVSARQTETGFSRAAQTDRDGAYLLLELPVGHYQLVVEAKGFQKYLQDGISLSVNQTATVPVRLVVGAESQQVQVSADAQFIQSTVTSLGKTVQEREILDLPLNGRHFSQLGTLQPGVVPITPGLLEAGGSLRSGQPYAVNGQRPESNNFLVDGANNFNGVDGGFVLEPPVDAITEFKILTHGANAEFGHSTGSTTNIVTRSGSNSIHGSAWEFLRNDALDASDFIAKEVTPLKQNQFGGTLGGPIRKDKTFVFGYYEGFRNREGRSNTIAVPSLAERQGDFSAICTEGFTSGFCNNPDQQLFNVFTMTPYPNNQLDFINPISQNLLQFFPEPNSGPNGFLSTQVIRENEDQFGVRVDQYLSATDSLNFRYSFSDADRFVPISPNGANVPGFPVGENQRAQNFVVQDTHTFSPQMIAVLRFSFLRNKFLLGERFSHTPPSSLGFQYEPSLEEAIGVPFMQVNGYSSIGNPITGPRNTYQNSFDYSGAVTWALGGHELKFGGGYERQQINALQGIATNGFFVFVPFPVVPNSFASFLWGQPVFFLQGRGEFGRNIRGQALNGYVQDTFKVTPRLTLNLGVRYELPFPYTEVNNEQNLFIPGRQSQVIPNAPAGLLYPGDPGVPAGLIATEKKGFAPRVGVAWNPTGSGNWLVTSSYGIFYEPYYTGQGGPL